MVTRPCFLVVDQEFPGSISSRKLVIETAKYNVVTAYSPQEAIETLRRFPNVDGIVLGVGIGGDACRKLVEQLKAIDAKKPIVLTAAGSMDHGCGADHIVPSFEPAKLLEKLQSLCGENAQSLQRHEDSLTAAAVGGAGNRN